MLTDRHGAVVHANRMGDSLLGQGELLDAAAGVIRARQPGADQELQQALRLSASDEAAMGSTGVTIWLSRPQCPPVFAHVLPLGGTPLRQELEPQATAALFVSPGPNPQDCVDTFAATHHLTPAEARVVQALVAGHSLTEAAELLRVGRATAKTQLESVFRKAGVTRQADLIRLVTQLAPVRSVSPQLA
ncbi:MAG: helix-turn-helix transcriptional regulator [Proteobacteria bacterium]|nr:hypothetical protein [Methylibium sp.]MBY0366522.1 helix-turn-helix transcriptional regulator [Burkholderiaceae bacterium]MCH8855331.1 helix-turn-helix transcriptional regulator [Pseudomonadota bacterium]